MTVTRITDVVASGNEVTWTFTLSGTGDITGATITANIQPSGSPTNVISAHAMSVLSGVGRTCTLTLTEAECVLMTGGSDPRQTEDYIIDVTCVLAGVTTNYGPAVQSVRSVVGTT